MLVIRGITNYRRFCILHILKSVEGEEKVNKIREWIAYDSRDGVQT